MSKHILILAAIAAAAFNSAWLMEGTNNNCGALEHFAMRQTSGTAPSPLAGAFFALSNGQIAANIAAEKFPNLPAPLGCDAAYWLARWNSRLTAKIS